MESRIVSEMEDRHDELLAAVEKSEARLKQRPSSGQISDRSPPEKVSDLVREHPGLAIAAGLGLGILASVLIPRSPARKLVRRGGLVASAVAEMALVLGQQALSKASEVREEGRERLGEVGEQVGDAAHRAAAASRAAGRNVQRIVSDGSAAARDVGSDLAHRAGKIASETSSAAREAGSGIAHKAQKAFARLRD
jgi:ElaB/YqjD/DUF883 family membrane-anchored ribosome-binding protein